MTRFQTAVVAATMIGLCASASTWCPAEALAQAGGEPSATKKPAEVNRLAVSLSLPGHYSALLTPGNTWDFIVTERFQGAGLMRRVQWSPRQRKVRCSVVEAKRVGETLVSRVTCDGASAEFAPAVDGVYVGTAQGLWRLDSSQRIDSQEQLNKILQQSPLVAASPEGQTPRARAVACQWNDIQDRGHIRNNRGTSSWCRYFACRARGTLMQEICFETGEGVVSAKSSYIDGFFKLESKLDLMRR